MFHYCYYLYSQILFWKIIIKKFKKIILILAISFNIIILIVFKYVDFIILNLNLVLKTNIELFNLPFPLAISFITFQVIAFF